VSLACAHAAAAAREVPLWQYLASDGPPALPMPMVNLISGGLHDGGNLDFQDFLFLPVSARSFAEALEMTVAVYRALGQGLRKHGFEGVLVGDEGGFGPRLENNQRALEMILAAFRDVGLGAGKNAAIALDVASTHFHCNGRYHLRQEGGEALSAAELAERLLQLTHPYPVLSIEDGLSEDDWAGWRILTAILGDRVQLIGDDLFVTNPERLRHGIAEGVANSVLVKLNQIGTLTETLEVLRIA